MSAVLERIKVNAIARPTFDNTHLGVSERAWIDTNTAKLARWWTEQGGGTDPARDAAHLNLWLRIQHEIELIHQGKRP